jgi:hypothetical protein
MPEPRPRLSPRAFIGIAVVAAVLCLAAACALPHDRYIRFQGLTEPEVVKVGWIYERIHFDTSPIDVVFIGTSHTVFGVDDETVERSCRNAGGKSCASVNFAIEHLGRDMHWLLTREVLEARHPKLLVVEVQETEYRALHPAFAYLADAGDLFSAPLIINTSYFDDLVRLPLRQISLSAQTLAPSLFGVHRKFIPALYRGRHWVDAYAEYGSIAHPAAHPVPRTGVASNAELERERAHSESDDASRTHLPMSLRPLEYRANLLYLEALLTLAREKNIEIRFLYMPAYRGPPTPGFASFYDRFAPTWLMPREIVDNHEMWLDVAHLNYAGATALSQWLGMKIATDIPGEMARK